MGVLEGSRRTTNHHWRVAGKSGEVRQKSEAKQNKRKNVGEEYSIPRGKCIAKGRRIIWRKEGTNNVKNRGRIWRGRRRKYIQQRRSSNRSKKRPKCNGGRQRKGRGQNVLYMQKVGPYSQKLLGKTQRKSSRNAIRVGKRKWRIVSSQLASNNLYSVLHPEKLGNKSNFINTTKRVRDVWLYTMATKRSLDEGRTREVRKPQRGSSKSTARQWDNRSIHGYNLCQRKGV